jgi:magnesium transporter
MIPSLAPIGGGMRRSFPTGQGSDRMLLLNTGSEERRTAAHAGHGEEITAAAIWLDLLSPSEEERATVERHTGLRIPARAELEEIESSSRLSQEDGHLVLSTPILARGEGERFEVRPLGFVLSPDRLVTIRYAALPPFDSFAEHLRHLDAAGRTAPGVFVGLVEALVDRLADILENTGKDLDRISHRVFRAGGPTSGRVANAERDLRDTLRAIGRCGDMVSDARDSLLGLGRIVAYFAATASEWTAKELHVRLKTLRQDIASINDYDRQLTDKVQFLLDATLGFINIQQNNIIKILTVVSIVGIPPTLIASIYGMNFKNIPELDWSWGYEYGLTMILISAILPLVIFKWRGWL